jgi:hypothetical protein
MRVVAKIKRYNWYISCIVQKRGVSIVIVTSVSEFCVMSAETPKAVDDINKHVFHSYFCM